MSLINDALKKARQSPPVRKVNRGPDTSMQPAPGPKSGPKGATIAAIAVGVIAVSGAVWLFVKAGGESVNARTAGNAPGAATNAPSVPGTAANAVVAPAPLPEPIQSAAAGPLIADDETEANHVAPKPDPAPVVETQNSDTVAQPETEVVSSSVDGSAPEKMAVAAATQEAAADAGAGAPASESTSDELPAPARPPAFPDLKLQGVYYRLTKPSVMINNRTLYVGDKIDGARVIGIKRYSVQLDFGGETKELSLR